MTPDDAQALLEAFERAAIPAERWTHRTHLAVAYLYLRRHSRDEAERRMRTGIRALNASLGVPDELHSGYHETITGAWMRILEALMVHQDAPDDPDAFLDENAYLLGKKMLRLFYSRERIMSAEAKARFLPPDLTDLPRATA